MLKAPKDLQVVAVEAEEQHPVLEVVVVEAEEQHLVLEVEAAVEAARALHWGDLEEAEEAEGLEGQPLFDWEEEAGQEEQEEPLKLELGAEEGALGALGEQWMTAA